MEEKLEKYRCRVYHFILRFVKDSALAEDLTQDVMLKIWLRRDRIIDLVAVDAYVLRMSKNHVFDHFKKLAKEKTYQEEVWHHMQHAENHMENKLGVRDIEARLGTILNELPTRQQQVYELNRDKGFSLQEIAEKLDIAPNTAKNHLTRAMKVIRSQMNPESFLLISWMGIFY